MAEFHIKKGLDVPITGEPNQEVSSGKSIDHVAIVAADFVGMKPKMLCEEGSVVKRGQPLFEDRKNPGVLHTALGAGTVVKINRGAKRALQTFVIELNENERAGTPSAEDHHSFEHFKGGSDYTPEELESLLVESGMWTSLRTRPYSRNPEIGSRPNTLFLTCTDSEPLSGDSNVILAGQEEDFLSRCVVDPVARKFYLYSEQGDEKVVECETVDQFMSVLELVRDSCNEDILAYADPV